MDSVTHICLGACTGEILLGRKLGKRALFWGILAQNLPDTDELATVFYHGDKALLIHRGITHSLLFAFAAGLLMAMLARKIHSKTAVSFTTLASFFCFEITLHDLLDTCNSYGTGLLEPFSSHRFSVNLLYVADPLFTLSLFVVFLFLILKRGNNIKRKLYAVVAVVISALYLCFSVVNKIVVDKKVKSLVATGSVTQSEYFTTPAPFNNMLWYVVVAADSGYYTGYRSVWDDPERTVDLNYHPQNRSLINGPIDYSIVKNLETFGADFYVVSKANNTLYFNILRFEQVQGWLDPDAPFAFSYPLTATENQELLLQRGRLAGWNKKTFKLYLSRIAGNQTY